MIGAIAGDIIGSAYEFHSTKNPDFDLFLPESRFTDDTVLTVAVADCILSGRDYGMTIREYGNRYPGRGYGGRFRKWLGGGTVNAPYNSYGNGSAMRVSPVAFAFTSLESVLLEAKKSAEVTHNHPEGIKGAQATAAAIFLARTGKNREAIREYVESSFGYDLHQTIEAIRPGYGFDETCQGSVPQAIIAFLDSDSYEDAVRKAVSLGGDADTQACIAGGIAQAHYSDIPDFILKEARRKLSPELLQVIDRFCEKYCLLQR